MDTSSQYGWREVTNILQTLIPFEVQNHRHIIQIEDGNTISDQAQRPKKFLLACEPYAKEIDAAVDEWRKGQQLTLPSDEHKIYFLYRVLAAVNFARLHTMIGRTVDRTVLPEPSCTATDAVAYLLKDWWYERGYREYYYEAKSGNDLINERAA